MLKKNAQKVQILALALCLMLVSAGSALATGGASSLIDYTSVAGDLTGILTTAVTAAIGVGVLVLGAKFGWRFFKSFTK